MPVLNDAPAVYRGDTLLVRAIQNGVTVWEPAPVGGGKVTQVGGSVVYGGNTAGAAITVPLPAGLQAGDYLLAFVFVSNQLAETQYGPTPAGWTRLYMSGTSTGRSGWVYGMAWNGTDTQVVFEVNAGWGTSRRLGGVIAARGVDVNDPIAAVATANPYLPAVGTAMSVPSDLSTVDGALHVVVADANTSANNYAIPTVEPAGWDRPVPYGVGPGDGTGASASWMHLFTREVVADGVQAGPSWTWQGPSIASHKAWHFALRPA